MLVETDNLVTTEQFRADLEKYVAAARHGEGPIAITENSEVVGVLINPDEYEAMFGAAVKNLLSSRMEGPTVSQQDARDHIASTIRRSRAKP